MLSRSPLALSPAGISERGRGRTQEGLCQGRKGLGSNPHSKPEAQSIHYCHSCSCCSFTAPTGSDPLVTEEEKLPNLVTSLGTLVTSCVPLPSCSFSLCRAAGLISLFCHRGTQTPEKKLLLLSGENNSCSRCYCYFLIVTLLSVFYSIGDVMFTSGMFLAALSFSDELLSLCKQVVCLLCAVPLSQQPES